MIRSFRHKGLEEFFYSGSKKGIRPEHAGRLERVLDRLNAAGHIKDMNYPGSFLHRLSGDKEGQYAVKVSGNWRVFFEFIDSDAFVVDYADYHGEVQVMKKMKRQPTHPGRIIKEDYLEPLGIPVMDMAILLGVSRKTLSKILNQRGSVTPDMALRLSRALDTTPELWLNLQRNFDLWYAETSSKEWQNVRPLSSRLLHPEESTPNRA